MQVFHINLASRQDHNEEFWIETPMAPIDQSTRLTAMGCR